MSVARDCDELWLGVKSLSNLEIAVFREIYLSKVLNISLLGVKHFVV